MDVSIGRPQPFTGDGNSKENSAMMSLWEAVDLCLRHEGIDSLTSMGSGTAERTDGTVVTNETADRGGYDSWINRESACGGERSAGEQEDWDDEISILTEENSREDDNDGPRDRDGDSDGDGGGDPSWGTDESYEESRGQEEHESCGGDDSSGEFETDDDGADDRDDVTHSDGGSPSPLNGGDLGVQPHHEMFLPRDVPPSTESLKYEKDDDEDESSDEEDDDSSFHSYCTYAISNGRSGRPRMWDGCSAVASQAPSNPPTGGSRRSRGSRQTHSPKARGVSFNDSVTVHPIFEIDDYPPSMIQKMYTGCKEIRVNRQRNLREYAHDKHDWRNATEEDSMEPNGEGELVHPATRPPLKRKVLQFRSRGGSADSGAGVAKRTKTCVS